MAEVKRSARVGERLREEIATLIVREVRDPRVAGAAITEVEMTADLQLAKVRVRRAASAPGVDDEASRKALLAGLQSAAGMLRREASKKLGLRHAPRLVFYYDEAPEKRSRIDSLLDEIAKEPRAPEGDEK